MVSGVIMMKHLGLMTVWLMLFQIPFIASQIKQFNPFGCSNDAVPLEIPPPYNCSTCVGRCGHVMTSYDDPCSCDPMCGVHGDCCHDFEEACPQQFGEATSLSAARPYLNSSHTSCTLVTRSAFSSISLSIVTNCRDLSPCPVYSNFLDIINLDRSVPVVDVETGLHYLSSVCARCNGVKQAKPWNYQVDCESFDNNWDDLKTLLAENKNTKGTDAMDILSGCSASVNPPMEYPTRSCIKQSEILFCESTCLNEELSNRCLSHGRDILTNNLMETFQNYYCFLCSNLSIHRGNLRCGYQRQRTAPRGETTLNTFSLTLLLDYNPSNSLRVGTHVVECSPELKGYDSVWIEEEGKCREFKCDPGYHLYKDYCVTDVNLQVNVSVTLMIRGSMLYSDDITVSYNTETELKNTLDDSISYAVSIFMGNRFQKSCMPYQYIWSNLDSIMHQELSFDYQSTCEVSTRKPIEDIEKALKTFLANHLDTLETESISSKNITSYDINIMVGNTTIGEEHTCGWFAYKEAELNIKGDTVVVKVTNVSYLNDSYRKEIIPPKQSGFPPVRYPAAFEPMHYLVCRNYNVNSNVTDEGVVADELTGLAILTIVLGVLSIICLAIRLILQPLDKKFQSFPGIIQFHLVLALIIAFLSFFLSPLLQPFQWPCSIVASVKLWGFLASFFWMNIIAFDTWRVFRPGDHFSNINDPDRKLWPFLVYGWIAPLIIAIIALIINTQPVDDRFKPHYEDAACWFDQRYSMIVFFVVPVGILILINIVLYIMTSVALRQSFNESKSVIRGEEERSHHGVYIRLFVLMGVSWLVGLVAGAVQNTVLWYIYVILNASQGVAIFIFFVCTRQRMKQFIRCCCRCQQTPYKKNLDSNNIQLSSTDTKSNDTHSTNLSTNSAHKDSLL